MRKILFLNSTDFNHYNIIVKNQDGVMQEIKGRRNFEEEKFYSKYTAQEIRKIAIINSRLDMPMTDEEIDYMLTNGLTSKNMSPDDIAARAGYRIEKRIVPL